ncbi:MAG: PPOX class F420-dependent oxidoreductase [Anaerolineales bacterium]|jgi:hypothetical protein|nr:PPOX class F420-dependent oxidoreductase [Anaerolineales bacterium]
MSALDAFQNQQYLNLETFRKSGVGVKTPVWFVQEDGVLFVRTVADSGKVKRIRNSAMVNIAPCKVDGALVGAWAPASAREVKDQDTSRKVDRMLGKKYGLMKTLFAWTSALQRRKYTVLEIKLR